jgi:hypothetical protein
MLQRLKAAQDQGVDVNGLWIQDWVSLQILHQNNI